jgi:hypothetical protein
MLATFQSSVHNRDPQHCYQEMAQKTEKREKNKAKRDEDYREGLCRATHLHGSSVDGIDETNAGGPHTSSSLQLEISH